MWMISRLRGTSMAALCKTRRKSAEVNVPSSAKTVAELRTLVELICSPVTPAMTEAGELASHHLREVLQYLFETPPLTLVHHDFDGDNLFFPVLDSHPPVVVLDWQLTTRAHSAVDIGWLIGGQCEPEDRRRYEHELVEMYHGLLVDQGVTNYGFDRCWDDYRLSMLLAVARTSGSVGLQPEGPRGGPWDTIVPRYCQAVSDLGVAELVARP